VRGRATRTPEDNRVRALQKARLKVGRAWSIKEAANAMWQCAAATEAFAVQDADQSGQRG